MIQTKPDLLPWLLPVSKDLRDEMRLLGRGAGPVEAARLRALAGQALDLDQLTALDRLLGKAAGRLEEGAAPLERLRFALLADGSTEFLAPALRATGLRHGFLLEVYRPAYGQATAEAMDPESGLAAFRPQAGLVAGTPQGLRLTEATLDAEAAAAAVHIALETTRRQVAGIRAQGAAMVLVQTLPQAGLSWAGNLDRRIAGSPRGMIAAYNAGLAELAGEQGLILLDAEAMAAAVGAGIWFDAGLWHRAKVPMALDAIPLHAEHVCRLLAAARGRSAKCLVLDLDNTCWGGVIGDDGLDGIRLGQGSADGEAFLAVQAYALALKARGIVLAVCSKNDDAVARSPFLSHPDMMLRLEDITVFVADWSDKATNVARIAKTLNIGTDALVLLDDNPAERARVRQSYPEVRVPEVGDDPALYPAILSQAGYFETAALTADDARRAEQYRANALRLAQMEEIGDYDAYLASLEMRCEIRRFDATGRARIVQLINKSNQFNLTTRRYTETEVGRMETDPGVLALQVRLSDRFGDNGMVSVVVFRKGGTDWICDTWLMSCRVLKRRVEDAVLNVVVEAARREGAARLVGEYIPSSKNAMVAGHFEALGFTADGATPGGGTRWALPLEGFRPVAPPMEVAAAAVLDPEPAA